MLFEEVAKTDEKVMNWEWIAKVSVRKIRVVQIKTEKCGGFQTQELPKDFLKGEFFNVCAIQMILLKILE